MNKRFVASLMEVIKLYLLEPILYAREKMFGIVAQVCPEQKA